MPFVLGSLRSAGTGTRMLMGLLLGIGFFLLQRLIESGTIVFNLNPVRARLAADDAARAVTLGFWRVRVN